VNLDDSIEVLMKIEENIATPDQAMIEFRTSSSDDVYFAFSEKKGSLHLFLDISKDLVAPCHNLNSNHVEYSLTIFVSDDKMDAPIQWNLGKLSIPVKPNQALRQKCEFSETQLWNARSEFTHQFKSAAPRAPVVIAMVFVVLLISIPNMWLLSMASKFRVSYRGPYLLFLSLVIGLMAIVVIYWFDIIKLFPTLFFLTVTGSVATAVRPRAALVAAEKKKSE
jgi:hypothetical protein